METPFMERIKVLVENKKFLDSQKYHDASIYYILKKEQDGAVSYKGVAEYEQENCCHSVIMNKENQRGGPLLAEQGVLEPWHYERGLQKGGSICL